MRRALAAARQRLLLLQRRSGACAAAAPFASAAAAPPSYPRRRPPDEQDPYGWMRTADPHGELGRYLAQESRLYRAAGLGSGPGWAAIRRAIERQAAAAAAAARGGGSRGSSSSSSSSSSSIDAPEPSGPYEYWEQAADDEEEVGWRLMRRKRRRRQEGEDDAVAHSCLSSADVRRDAALAARGRLKLRFAAAQRPSFSLLHHDPAAAPEEDLFGPGFDAVVPDVRLSHDHGSLAYLLPYAPSAAAREAAAAAAEAAATRGRHHHPPTPPPLLPPDGAALLVVRSASSSPGQLPLAMVRAATGAEFAPWSEQDVYYVEPDARTGRPWRVRVRRWAKGGGGGRGAGAIDDDGAAANHDENDDPVLFEERDPRHFVALTRTKDWRALVVNSHSKLSSEVRLMLGAPQEEGQQQRGGSGGGGGSGDKAGGDAAGSSSSHASSSLPLLLIAPRRPGVEYFVEHQAGRALVLTNAPELFLPSAAAVGSRDAALAAASPPPPAKPSSSSSSAGRDYALLAAPLLEEGPDSSSSSTTWRLGQFELLAPEPRGRCRAAPAGADDDSDDALVAATTDLDVFQQGVVLQQRDSAGRPALTVVRSAASSSTSSPTTNASAPLLLLRARLPAWALALEPRANQDYSDGASFRFDLSSPSRPPEPYELDLLTGEVRPLVVVSREGRKRADEQQQEEGVLVCRRLVAPCLPGDEDEGDEGGGSARAGVPLTVLYRQRRSAYDGDDANANGGATATPQHHQPRVVVLEAYGAYGRPLEASWRADRAALALEHGWVFVLAHARGGGELGRRWHWLGRGSRKGRSARDVVAAARYLVREGFVGGGGMEEDEGGGGGGGGSSSSGSGQQGRIALMASSAGAVAAAGALLSDPGLFGAAVLEVPFVDALAEMRAGGLAESAPLDLLAQHEQDEWGDDDDDHHHRHASGTYRALERGACPYQALLRRLSRRPPSSHRLPPLLLTAAADDARVRLQGVARFAALYRDAAAAAATPPPEVLLRVAAEGGHLSGGTCGGDPSEAAELYEFVRRALADEGGGRGRRRR
jgi:hypothetical protein